MSDGAADDQGGGPIDRLSKEIYALTATLSRPVDISYANVTAIARLITDRIAGDLSDAAIDKIARAVARSVFIGDDSVKALARLVAAEIGDLWTPRDRKYGPPSPDKRIADLQKQIDGLRQQVARLRNAAPAKRRATKPPAAPPDDRDTRRS